MFDKDFKITGKHAGYWKDLCVLAGNVPDREEHNNFKIFKAYIDAYILCPIIGYQHNRKGVMEKSDTESAGMLSEVIIKRSSELKFIYQIIMLADEEAEPDPDKRIYKATTFSEQKEEDKKMISENMKLFNSYFLGGLEVLHEEFVEKCITDNDYLKAIFDYVRHFEQEQDGEGLKNSINEFLK